MMLRAIVVDDELSAVNRFIRLCEQTETVLLVGSFTDPNEAYEFLKNNEIDLAYLDIEMPHLNGLALSKLLFEVDPNIHVVFITAYEKYAIDAFGAHAVGYLLKPVTTKEIEEQAKSIVKRKTHQKPKLKKLNVHCFGQFSCFADEECINWKTSKSEELFAFLIHNGGKPVSKDVILDALWGEMDVQKAANNLYSTWYYIRETLHAKGFTDVLHKSLGNYQLVMDMIQCDFIDYTTLLSGAKAASDNIAIYETAASLYKGAYFDGKPYDWISGKQAFFEIENETVQLRLSELYVAKGDSHTASKTLMNMIQNNPLSEKAYQQLILLFIQQRDFASALKHYKKLENILRKELGVSPSPDLIQLMDDLL